MAVRLTKIYVQITRTISVTIIIIVVLFKASPLSHFFCHIRHSRREQRAHDHGLTHELATTSRSRGHGHALTTPAVS